MQKMTEEEFDKIAYEYNIKECDHSQVVRLYYMGTHTDYGCMKCGMKSTVKEHFNK